MSRFGPGCANTPEMKAFLGGVEPDDRAADRHRRILADPLTPMLLIVVPEAADPVGSVGCWERAWQGETLWEMGWQILPAFQGRGLATAAVTELLRRTDGGRHRWVHAYPHVDNRASHAVCRRTGFTLLGDLDFEFPPGTLLHCNNWRYDLTPPPRPA
jgi:RimJ/RimL family protein N-acetyltransferase